jgi:hypothetical protein
MVMLDLTLCHCLLFLLILRVTAAAAAEQSGQQYCGQIVGKWLD